MPSRRYPHTPIYALWTKASAVVSVGCRAPTLATGWTRRARRAPYGSNDRRPRPFSAASGRVVTRPLAEGSEATTRGGPPTYCASWSGNRPLPARTRRFERIGTACLRRKTGMYGARPRERSVTRSGWTAQGWGLTYPADSPYFSFITRGHAGSERSRRRVRGGRRGHSREGGGRDHAREGVCKGFAAGRSRLVGAASWRG